MKIRDAWFLGRKDVAYMLRSREALAWIFVMPIVFFYFIGTVTGGFSGNGPREDRLTIQLDEEPGFLAEALVERLDRDYEVVRAGPGTAASTVRHVELGEGFSEAPLHGEVATVRLMQGEPGPMADFDAFRVGRATYGVLADLLACAAAGEEPGPESFARLAAMPRALTVTVRPAGERQHIPTGFEQAIPGTMVMFTLIAVLTNGAVLLVIERRRGLLRRLASTPIARSSVVLGKWGGKMALAVIQIGFAMLAGTLLFRLDWGPSPAMVGVVLFAWAAFCASLGLLLGSVARTEGQAVGIGVLAGNLLAALGGCWWPIEVTPSWMQAFAKLLPTGWTMDALHRLVSFQHAPASAVPHVITLAVGAVVLGAAAVVLFRFD